MNVVPLKCAPLPASRKTPSVAIVMVLPTTAPPKVEHCHTMKPCTSGLLECFTRRSLGGGTTWKFPAVISDTRSSRDVTAP